VTGAKNIRDRSYIARLEKALYDPKELERLANLPAERAGRRDMGMMGGVLGHLVSEDNSN
jgi:hypothetical protein